MSKKKGTDFELIVKHIEKKLNPNSKIENNIFLPDLLNPPHKRECDIVLTEKYGKREMLTIFEVQNRASKVKIGDLTNFIEKRNALGANRLIVVSKLPFSQSVIDKAKKCGPSVQLINYTRILEDEFDVGVRFQSIKDLGNPQIDYGSDGYEFSEEEKSVILKLMNNDEKIILYNNKLLSIKELHNVEKNRFSVIKPGFYPYDYKYYANTGTKVKLNENYYPIKIRITGKFEVEYNNFLEIYEYKAVNDDAPYVFHSEGVLKIDGNIVEVKLTYSWIEELMCYQVSTEVSKNENITLNYIKTVNKKDM